nr:hypothetical protein CFP56_52680 [Quercus suber]
MLNQEMVQSFQDLLWYMLTVERSDVDEVAKVVCIAWAMWHNRNESRHGGKRRSEAELRSWAPPPEKVFKINVDGVVFASQNIRDEKGRLEVAMSKKIPAPLFAVEVEVMAYK